MARKIGRLIVPEWSIWAGCPLSSPLNPECGWRSRLGKDGPIGGDHGSYPQLPHTAIDTSDARPLAGLRLQFLGLGYRQAMKLARVVPAIG